MKNTQSLVVLATLFLVLASPGESQKQWIFSAMKDEMDRSVKSLTIDTLGPPYYIAYSVTESESYTLRATMGSLLSVNETPRSRGINVQLRVGTMSFDNTNFLSFGSFGRSGVAYVSSDGNKETNFEDDESLLRRDLWIATDAVYKRALADLSKKKAAFQNKVRTDTTADFSTISPYSATVSPVTDKLNVEEWKTRTKKLSAVLKQYPGIQYSRVSTGLINDYVYFLSSDGAKSTRQKIRAWVEVKARTQAGDGMPLANFVAFYGNSMKELPSEEEMRRQIEAMARELLALRDAPTLDFYSGPVLFEGQAAAELVSQIVAQQLCAVREPAAESPQMEQMVRSQVGDLPYQNKIGARVLPEYISMRDDPTLKSFKGEPLVGGYMIDEEGIQAKEVKLVENGILKTLLSSRTPHRRIQESNGHGRGYPPQAFFSNFIVSSRETKSDSDLKKELISICKDRDLANGIIVRKIVNPYFQQQWRDDFGGIIFAQMGAREALSNPLLVYKVFSDGREELVRGVEFSGITTQTFKEILGVGDREFVYNHLTSPRRGTLVGLFRPGETRVAVVTPSLFFESIDLKKSSARHTTAPVAPSPLQRK